MRDLRRPLNVDLRPPTSGGRPAAVPLPFDAVEVVVRLVLVLVEADVVEDEELGFKAELGDVGQSGRLHVGLGLAGNVARIFGIVLAGDRVLDVAGHGQRGLHERVDDGRFRLRDDEHVAEEG